MKKYTEDEFYEMYKAGKLKELFSECSFINIPNKNVREDALNALLDETTDVDEQEYVIMPVECEYISYSNEGTGFRIKFENGREAVSTY